MPDNLFEQYQTMLNDIRRAERLTLTTLDPSTPFLNVIELGMRFAKIRAHAQYTFHVLSGVK